MNACALNVDEMIQLLKEVGVTDNILAAFVRKLDRMTEIKRKHEEFEILRDKLGRLMQAADRMDEFLTEYKYDKVLAGYKV